MDGDKGTILTQDERNRLVELIDLYNNLNVTQVDPDEIDEFNTLMNKLMEV